MSDMLKRRKATAKSTPDYPSADEVGQDRRRFLRLLGKGLLGVSVLGLARCNAGAGDPFLADGLAEDVLESDEWVTGGIAPPPDTIDTIDTTEDVEDEFPPPPGDMAPPDTIDHVEDVEDEFPPTAGGFRMPDGRFVLDGG